MVCRGRTIGAGNVVREVLRRVARPDVEDRLNGLPTRLNIVSALKQRRVTNHTIIDERLVTGVRLSLKIIFVGEVHRHVAQLYRWTRALGRELKPYTFMRLDP